MSTNIEWADETWNPVVGCSKVSEGCRNCYAEGVAARFARQWGHEHRPWTATNAEHNVHLHPDRVSQLYRWRKPRRIFVNSMSDLFHEQVPYEFIRDVFEHMWGAHWHIYQVLTKRPERMLEVIPRIMKDLRMPIDRMKNIWLGVSVEDQKTADERIPLLLQTPAKVRFLSCEPMLGQVDLSEYLMVDYADDSTEYPISWVIVGGESGKNARPMHPYWVRLIRDQCQEAKVPFFFKQRGEWTWDGFEPYFGYGSDSGKWDSYICKTGESGTCKISDDDGLWINWTGMADETVQLIRRVGKKKAGRLLDGQVWNEMPQVGGRR